MAAVTSKTRCAICGKEKSTVKCEGCSQTFCYNHLGDHRQQLSQQLDEVEVARDLFRQTLTKQTKEPQKHPLIQEINQWERESINKIQQVAEGARQMLLKDTTRHITRIEVKLNKLTEQLRESREENDFFETDLQQWNEQLKRMKEDLIKPSKITLRQDSTPIITKIYVDLPGQKCNPNITVNAKWAQNGITVAGGIRHGNGLNQLENPHGLYVDDDQSVYIAEYSNHRIVEWKSGATCGRIVAGGNGQGNRANQLSNPKDVVVDKESDSLIICDYGNQRVMRWPRQNGAGGQIIISGINCWGLAIDNNGDIYVSDQSKHEVRRWKMGDISGTVVAGGNGQGKRLNQLDSPAYIFVDQDHSVYVSEYKNDRVMKWIEGAKEGVVVADGQGTENDRTQLNYPRGVIVDQLGTVYVVDNSNHQVMRWFKGITQGTIIVGGNGEGKGPNEFSNPMGLSFDRQGNLYVADNSNHRIQKFNIDPSSNA